MMRRRRREVIKDNQTKSCLAIMLVLSFAYTPLTHLLAFLFLCRDEAPIDLNLADGEIESNWDTVTDNFDNMELKPELLRGIYAYG